MEYLKQENYQNIKVSMNSSIKRKEEREEDIDFDLMDERIIDERIYLRDAIGFMNQRIRLRSHSREGNIIDSINIVLEAPKVLNP